MALTKQTVKLLTNYTYSKNNSINRVS